MAFQEMYSNVFDPNLLWNHTPLNINIEIRDGINDFLKQCSYQK